MNNKYLEIEKKLKKENAEHIDIILKLIQAYDKLHEFNPSLPIGFTFFIRKVADGSEMTCNVGGYGNKPIETTYPKAKYFFYKFNLGNFYGYHALGDAKDTWGFLRDTNESCIYGRELNDYNSNIKNHIRLYFGFKVEMLKAYNVHRIDIDISRIDSILAELNDHEKINYFYENNVLNRTIRFLNLRASNDLPEALPSSLSDEPLLRIKYKESKREKGTNFYGFRNSLIDSYRNKTIQLINNSLIKHECYDNNIKEEYPLYLQNPIFNILYLHSLASDKYKIIPFMRMKRVFSYMTGRMFKIFEIYNKKVVEHEDILELIKLLNEVITYILANPFIGIYMLKKNANERSNSFISYGFYLCTSNSILSPKAQIKCFKE